MAETGRVFIWVQHLLGIGHLMRAAHIARFLAAHGWHVDLVSGGPPVENLDIGMARLHQLPAVRASDPAFSDIVDDAQRPLTDEFKQARRDLLLRLFVETDPDILVFEHFPFGRNQLRFELDTLLAAAAQSSVRPVIVSSVRDILVARRPLREAETVATVERCFDAVLVHGDPALVPLEASFEAAPRIARKVLYTGYVGGIGRGTDPPAGEGENEVIVSAGGGAVGNRLAEVAVEAATSMPHVRRWRILVGGNAGPRLMRKLLGRAPGWVTVEPSRADFRGLLKRSAVSVSQAGYNTVVDVLAAGARAILVPFETERETEQGLRAERLSRRGLARVLPESALNPDRLAAFVAESLALPRPAPRVKLDGEAETARILGLVLAQRRARST